MKRSAPPERKTQLAQMSVKRRAQYEAEGYIPRSTLEKPRARQPKMAAKPAVKRARGTGPSPAVCRLVDARSGGVCEWPRCGRPATDRHHRLNRKTGGRKGEAKARINGPAWLLAACRAHHDDVTSPTGETRKRAMAMGWLLLERQDATQVPVTTRHSPEPVWLDDLGHWHPYEEGAA